MNEAENLFGDEHVRRYRETGDDLRMAQVKCSELRAGRPARGLDDSEATRLDRQRRLHRTRETGMARITSDARRDGAGDNPRLVEARGKDAGAALAEIIVAAAAIDPAQRRLETNAAAET